MSITVCSSGGGGGCAAQQAQRVGGFRDACVDSVNCLLEYVETGLEQGGLGCQRHTGSDRVGVFAMVMSSHHASFCGSSRESYETGVGTDGRRAPCGGAIPCRGGLQSVPRTGCAPPKYQHHPRCGSLDARRTGHTDGGLRTAMGDSWDLGCACFEAGPADQGKREQLSCGCIGGLRAPFLAARASTTRIDRTAAEGVTAAQRYVAHEGTNRRVERSGSNLMVGNSRSIQKSDA